MSSTTSTSLPNSTDSTEAKLRATSAPGKAFLIGEYAVLHGGPSLVTAVGVRAVAHPARPEHEERPHPDSPFVAMAEEVVRAHLRTLGPRQANSMSTTPVVTTLGFDRGDRKVGFGSSAAVCASVIAYHLEGAGLHVGGEDPVMRKTAFKLAHAAHRQAQGGHGSGGDIAAAIFGGTLAAAALEVGHDGTPDPADRWSPVDFPTWLHVAFFDAGAPASTKARIQALDRARERDRQGYTEAMQRLRDAASDFRDAWARPCTKATSDSPDASPFAEICTAVAEHNRGLAALEALTDLPILTPTIQQVIDAAEAMGIAAKPSGAGGGDVVVVFSPDRARLDHMAARLGRDHGIAQFAGLRVHADGLTQDAAPPLNSRIRGFFKLTVPERRRRLARATGIDLQRFDDGSPGSLGIPEADHMVENVIGCLSLPLAIATNFRINGRDVLVPMCVEEASVVAAASNAAKMVRAGGGFAAHSDPPWMIAQIQLIRETSVFDPTEVVAKVDGARAEILKLADDAHPRLIERGGGTRDLEIRVLDAETVVIHVLVDCQDAMGANLVNTVAERVAPRLETITGWSARLRILSNLADRRASHLSARVPPAALATRDLDGEAVAKRIVEASRFAEIDPYRATTHNKGIMNGVDAVVLATGNDWRAMEASAHAFAARSGAYRPLATWRIADDGYLQGRLTLPTAVGVVGGATRVHPAARLSLKILESPSGIELGQIMAAAGLASNLAALRALATEGIQRGHMTLHARSVAASAGASGSDVPTIAARLIEDNEIKLEHAQRLLAEIRNSK